jgi:hypothetical protein
MITDEKNREDREEEGLGSDQKSTLIQLDKAKNSNNDSNHNNHNNYHNDNNNNNNNNNNGKEAQSVPEQMDVDVPTASMKSLRDLIGNKKNLIITSQ